MTSVVKMTGDVYSPEWFLWVRIWDVAGWPCAQPPGRRRRQEGRPSSLISFAKTELALPVIPTRVCCDMGLLCPGDLLWVTGHHPHAHWQWPASCFLCPGYCPACLRSEQGRVGRRSHQRWCPRVPHTQAGLLCLGHPACSGHCSPFVLGRHTLWALTGPDWGCMGSGWKEPI